MLKGATNRFDVVLGIECCDLSVKFSLAILMMYMQGMASPNFNWSMIFHFMK